VLQAALTAAVNGDVQAQKTVLDRLWPRPNGVFVRVELPFLANVADVEKASAQVVDDLVNSRLRTDEAEAIHAALRRHVEIVSGLEIGRQLEAMAQRLRDLESGRQPNDVEMAQRWREMAAAASANRLPSS
jgi:hypothetical protein